MATIDNQVTQPFARRHQLNHYQRQPGLGEAQAQAGKQGRDSRRQHDKHHTLPAAETIGPPCFQQALGRLVESLQGAQGDRHHRRLGNQHVLERLADAEQQQGKRQPAQDRDLHNGIEGGQQIILDGFRQPHRQPQRHTDSAPQGKPDDYPLQAGGSIYPQVARSKEIRQGFVNIGWRRQDLL